MSLNKLTADSNRRKGTLIICMGEPEERKMNTPKPYEIWKLREDPGLQRATVQASLRKVLRASCGREEGKSRCLTIW